MIFRDGVMVYGQPGALPEAPLVDLIKQARALDMEEVRRQIAERQAVSGRVVRPGGGPGVSGV